MTAFGGSLRFPFELFFLQLPWPMGTHLDCSWSFGAPSSAHRYPVSFFHLLLLGSFTCCVSLLGRTRWAGFLPGMPHISSQDPLPNWPQHFQRGPQNSHHYSWSQKVVPHHSSTKGRAGVRNTATPFKKEKEKGSLKKWIKNLCQFLSGLLLYFLFG